MESLIGDVVQSSSAFPKFLVLEGGLGTALYLHLILRRSLGQIIHSISGEKNLAPFHFW